MNLISPSDRERRILEVNEFGFQNTKTVNPIERLMAKSNIILLRSTSSIMTISFIGSMVNEIFDVYGSQGPVSIFVQ